MDATVVTSTTAVLTFWKAILSLNQHEFDLPLLETLLDATKRNIYNSTTTISIV
jgi:hypothetical protein